MYYISTNFLGLFGLLLPLSAKTTKANPLLICGEDRLSMSHNLILSPPTLAIGCDVSNDGEVLVNDYNVIIPHTECCINLVNALPIGPGGL